MCETMRAASQRLTRNGRGAKLLDYTLAAGNFVVTTVVLLTSAGIKLPIH
jgi:hypothetical protein